MNTAMTARQFLNDFVEPIMEELRKDPSNKRVAFEAVTATRHLRECIFMEREQIRPDAPDYNERLMRFRAIHEGSMANANDNSQFQSEYNLNSAEKLLKYWKKMLKAA